MVIKKSVKEKRPTESIPVGLYLTHIFVEITTISAITIAAININISIGDIFFHFLSLVQHIVFLS